MPVQKPKSTLWLILGAFTTALLLILLLAVFAMFLLDASRSYTRGESLYTKGQKEAVIALQRFAYSEDPDDLAAYRRAMAVPMGDRFARLMLERESPDLELARQGLLRGGNHPEDLGGMIRLFLWLGDTLVLHRPLELWRQADAVIVMIGEVAQALEATVAAEALTAMRRDQLLEELTELDRVAGEVQTNFSVAIGESARLVRSTAVVVLVTASLLLALAFALVTWRLDRRRGAAERSLSASEERLRILMNSTGDGILSITPDGRVNMANVAAGRLFGAPPDQLEGRDVQDLVSPESRGMLGNAMKAALAVNDANQTPRVWNLRGHRDTGQSFPMEALCALEETVAAQHLVLTLRDVTKREMVEEKLYQAQRMEAVGKLTAGIAHNFNNLLTVVIGGLDDLAESLKEEAADPKRRAKVSSALQAAERGAELTAQLLAFSRSQPLAPGPVDINSLIDDLRELLKQSVPANIEICYDLAINDLRASIDRTQLESALLNLVINAVHAMPEAGRIRIETEPRMMTAHAAAELDLAPGDYVVIRVADTGQGIAAENLSRVFEPFFTTKEVGVGTGLGLSMVHGFVRQSQGQIRIDSTINEGTTIELLLPVADEV